MPQDRKSPDIKQNINTIHLLRILEASDAPPVNSLTLASRKDVSAFPVMLFSLKIKNTVIKQEITKEAKNSRCLMSIKQFQPSFC